MTTTETPPRVRAFALAPDAYQAMLALDRAARAGLEAPLAELVKIRASQVNGCAYCLDMHTRDARAAGESEQRIYLLSAWRESPGCYTNRERAALALTEAVTLLPGGEVPDGEYKRAAEHFSDPELAHLISLIVAINAWNRFALAMRMAPGSHRPSPA